METTSTQAPPHRRSTTLPTRPLVTVRLSTKPTPEISGRSVYLYRAINLPLKRTRARCACGSTLSTMGAPVWGTFSVRDHCPREAFLREVLLFDRLVVPYPDPYVAEERQRWRQPDPAAPSETWDPDRLDELLGILGTEEAPGWNGAKLVQRVMWSPATWDLLRSKLATTEAVTGDPWMDTRLGLREPVPAVVEAVPAVVEAVAAYPSEEAWRQDVQPVEQEPTDISAMEALVQLPRPLLLPDKEADEIDTLRKAVDLAQDPEFQNARKAYFTWFRNFIEPLRSSEATTLEELKLDPGSLTLAEMELRKLWEEERRIARRGDRAKWFSRLEIACMTVGTAGSVGLAAATAAVPAVSVPLALLAFAGWTVARWNKPRTARSLGGATMFVDAQRHLDWLDPLTL